MLCAGCILTTKFKRRNPGQIFLSACECIVVFMLLLDPIFALAKANRFGGVDIRFGVPFRPLLVILWSRRIKEIISEVLEACRSLKFMAILTLAWLAISSMLLVQNVRSECGYAPAASNTSTVCSYCLMWSTGTAMAIGSICILKSTKIPVKGSCNILIIPWWA